MAAFKGANWVFAFIAILTGCKSDNRTHQEPITTTVLLSDKGIVVYAAGDIAACKNLPPEISNAAKTADIISADRATHEIAVVLTLGDNTYPIGLLNEFTGCYDPTWGKFKERTYPSPGNHDYRTPYAAGYYAYFGKAAGPERRGYYSFSIGSWHVISLNSSLRPDEHQTQLDWLKADLAQSRTHCTLAYWHHPMFSSGSHGGDSRMVEAWKILYAANAELVLASHDHHYERFAPQDAEGRRDEQRGLRQFVVGTGGAKLTPLGFQQAHSEVRDNSTYGVLRLVLKEAGYEWDFLPVEKNGFTDRGMALCH